MHRTRLFGGGVPSTTTCEEVCVASERSTKGRRDARALTIGVHTGDAARRADSRSQAGFAEDSLQASAVNLFGRFSPLGEVHQQASFDQREPRRLVATAAVAMHQVHGYADPMLQRLE